MEQKVPADMEWDEHDAASRHVVAYGPDGAAIGTGRLLPDGHVGRMAVVSGWRRKGVGTALLERLLESAASAGMRRLVLHAQTHAIGFYRGFGFAAEGDEFDEAGIPHVRMTRPLVT
jgi:predicted GNAT family N-acyltransferase